MRRLLALVLLSVPLVAQRQLPLRNGMKFPPDIIAPEDLVRDLVSVASLQVTVDLENARTRVLRVKLGPGEALPAHDDREGVLICLTNCRLRLTTREGRTQDLDLKAGETKWLPAARRDARNTGSAGMEMLYVESKRPPAPQMTPRVGTQSLK